MGELGGRDMDKKVKPEPPERQRVATFIKMRDYFIFKIT